MYDWLIIGGGVHGVTMATYLIKSGKATAEKLAIIDPYPSPLWKWKQNTERIKMPYLRSPSVHQLDPNPFGLEAFAKKNGYSSCNHFYGRYDRPSLSLFNEHCEHLYSELQLKDCWIQGKVCTLTRIENLNAWQATLNSGKIIVSKQVILAVGLSDQPYYPDWAAPLKQQGIPIHHIFEDSLPAVVPDITIIGGGITAAHYAIRLANEYPGKVTLLSRHSFRIHKFDSEPGWLGPKNMRQFNDTTCYKERRNMIKDARHKGSMTKELYMKLMHAETKGDLSIIVNEPVAVNEVNGTILIALKDKSFLKTKTVVLATGFLPSLPHWLLRTVQTEILPCATCGYPIVSPETLEWQKNLFVMGALAELEIGPVARNIAGARRAAERILKAT